MAGKLIRHVERRSGGLIPVDVMEATWESRAVWHEQVQPHIRNSPEFRFDKRWNWNRILWFHEQQEQLVGLLGIRPACELVMLQIVTGIQGGESLPIGQVLLASGFPFIVDREKPSVFLWYLAAAPAVALYSAGLPDDLRLLRPLIDIGVQESFAQGYDGRLCLHAARDIWEPSANRALYKAYEHIGMTPLRGRFMVSFGRYNSLRYFYFDESAALDFSNQLNYLR